MREAVESLIADLEFRKKEAYRAKVGNEGKMISAWNEGRANELGFVILRLKAVLNNASSDPHRTDGGCQNDTERQMDKPHG